MMSKAIWILALQCVAAQVAYNPNTNTLACTKPGGQYCFHGSLNGPTMLSCVSSTLAEIWSCNIELSLILPRGYNESATCYETSPNTGDAICAFNGTGYTLTGAHVAVPETRIQQFPVPDESRLRPDLTASAWTTQLGTNRKDVSSTAATATTDATEADMNVSNTNANAPTVHPIALIVSSSNTSTLTSPSPRGPLTTSNLRLDPSGEPDPLVSAISSEASRTFTGLVTSTVVCTPTAADTSSPRGIVVLVEPTSMTTTNTDTTDTTDTPGVSNPASSGSPRSPRSPSSQFQTQSHSPDISNASRNTTKAWLLILAAGMAICLIRS